MTSPAALSTQVLESLDRQGWAFFSGVRTKDGLLSVAQQLGNPIPSSSGELVKVLSPVDGAPRRGGSFSDAHGRGAFPFHTDTAFWGTPCRFLVMHVRGDTRRETHLLNFVSSSAALYLADNAGSPDLLLDVHVASR